MRSVGGVVKLVVPDDGATTRVAVDHSIAGITDRNRKRVVFNIYGLIRAQGQRQIPRLETFRALVSVDVYLVCGAARYDIENIVVNQPETVGLYPDATRRHHVMVVVVSVRYLKVRTTYEDAAIRAVGTPDEERNARYPYDARCSAGNVQGRTVDHRCADIRVVRAGIGGRPRANSLSLKGDAFAAVAYLRRPSAGTRWNHHNIASLGGINGRLNV